MGISAAMTPKERKRIYKGLLDQGATVRRDGKHGTIFDLPGEERATFTLPFGTSDHKARLAMRAEIKRAGFNWPLDPPDQQKERPVVTPYLRYNDAGEIWPPAASSQPMPREAFYREVEPVLQDYADKEFWTDEILVAAGGIGTYRTNTGMQRIQQMLWHAGFRVSDTKLNRNGFQYRWHKVHDWPTTFAPLNQHRGEAMPTRQQIREARRSEQLEAIDAIAALDLETPESAPAEEEIPMTDEEADEEIGLAEEQERRAMKAERERDGLRVSLDAEIEKHGETRRKLMARIAGQESTIARKDAEIARLRALIEEQQADGAVPSGDDGSILRRAAVAETRVSELERELQLANDRITTMDQAGALAYTTPINDGWWAMEPAPGQDLAALLSFAGQYGLEARLQARRK